MNFLTSMTLGLVLFALVALASIAGSVSSAFAESIYGSWWFIALLGALVLNTGFCTLGHIPRLARGSARSRIIFAVHVSVLILAAGFLWGNFAFSSTSVSVRVGESFPVAGDSWVLDGILVERYPDGSVSDWISIVRTPTGIRRIKVNSPAISNEVKILQAAYSREYRVKLEAGGESSILTVLQDTETPLTADGQVGFALSPPRPGLLASAQDEEGVLRTVDLLLTSGGIILQTTALFEGVPLALGDTGLVITVEKSFERSTFLVRNTPGLWLIWSGFGLMAISVTALMLVPGKHKETRGV